MMHRRSVLASAGTFLTASLAGCLGTPVGGRSPDHRIDDVITDAPPDLPLVPSIGVVSAESTEDQPLSLAVRWENDGEKPVRIGEERSVVFHATTSDNEGAYLLSDEYGNWDDTVALDACWYVSGAVNGDGAYHVGELAPGEAREVELSLYAATDGCFKKDAYRFQNTISVWESANRPSHPPSEEWGFVVNIDGAED